MFGPGNQYSACRQCVKCGITRPLETLKLARRINDILNIDERVHVCIDARVCARFKEELETHLARVLAEPITGKGGRPKKELGLTKRLHKQMYPKLAEARRIAKGLKP